MKPTTDPALTGKVALIIGAGRPLGRALALSLARAGAAIAAHDLAPNHLQETRRAVEHLGARCQTYTSDTGKGLSARSLLDDVLTDFEGLDILAHCLHISPPAGLLALDEWDWQRTLEINLSGPFLLLQAAAGVMRERGGGTIINILSTPPDDIPLAMSASQHGLSGLTKWAAAELLTYNINCYAVEAGSINVQAEMVPDVGGPHLSNSLEVLANLVVRLCTTDPERWIGKVIRLEEIT